MNRFDPHRWTTRAVGDALDRAFDRAIGEAKQIADRLRNSPLPARDARPVDAASSVPLPRVPVPDGDGLLDFGFEERMATVEFRVAPQAHIVVDSDVCRSCTTKACVTACPANLFVPTADGGVLFNYEQCFECGTCYMVCNNEGALTWTYPVGGRGVVMRRS